MKRLLATLMTAVLLSISGVSVAVAQDTSTEQTSDSGDTGMWGLAGLLGLAGLYGLKRRDDDRNTRPRP